MKNNLRTINIREATFKDMERFWNFFEVSVKKQFREYPIKVRKFFLEKHYAKNILKRWIKSRTIILLIAINDNKIVGYLMANLPYGGVAFIIWLAVQESFQNRGIGSLLLKEYEAIAKKQGAHKIFLSATRKQNLKFYKENGYKLGGYIPQSYFYMDEWRLYKKIGFRTINRL